MFRYSSIYINLLSLFISLVIFVVLELFFSNYDTFTHKSSLKAGFEVENTIQEKTNEVVGVNTEEEKNTWYLEIPKINLKADIKEGTTKEIMEDYIGHFEETKKDKGNVGLAAHNRGYKNNYFSRLKELEQGDCIFYNYQGETKEYTITKHIIIKDTDWTYLEDTDENTITLITCVENQPEYRRCIQGVELKESEEK